MNDIGGGPRILISLHGMGDAQAGDTHAWAKTLFPGAEEHSTDGRTWIDTDIGKVWLVEVRYEDVSEALLEKYEGLRELLPEGTPELIREKLEDFLFDVLQQVLVKEALDAAQLRFVGGYVEALEIAHAEVGAAGDVRAAKIGVLAHSLGTLVAYEGVHRAAESEDILDFVPLNMVLCAPMLRPICAVQSTLPGQSDRYLVTRGCAKPRRYNAFHDEMVPVVKRCVAFYDTDDPFHHIHSDEFYDSTVEGQDLVEEVVRYSSNPRFFWEGHDMIGSYLTHNRETIVEVLFS